MYRFPACRVRFGATCRDPTIFVECGSDVLVEEPGNRPIRLASGLWCGDAVALPFEDAQFDRDVLTRLFGQLSRHARGNPRVVFAVDEQEWRSNRIDAVRGTQVIK